MPNQLDWDHAEDIAIALADKFPDGDPVNVRFTDLHKWVIGLEGFAGDPKASNEGKLEAIQMAWLEEHNDRKNG
jgi:FeS assembly protein IscX